MPTELLATPRIHDRAEILDTLFPAGILHSSARSEIKLLAVYLWHKAGCCYAPFPLLPCELQKLGWKDHRTQEKWLAALEDPELEWVTADRLPSPEYDAVRLLTYTSKIWRVAETPSRQRTLFDLYPHTPPPMLGKLRRLAHLLLPMPLLLSQTLEPAHKLTAWYYLLAGDWERMESCIRFSEYAKTFNRDPKQGRTTVKELEAHGWWEVRNGRGYAVGTWIRPVYFASQAIELRTIVESDPTAASLFLRLFSRQELHLGPPVRTIALTGVPCARYTDSEPGNAGQTGVPSAQYTDSEPGNAGQTGVPSAQYTDSEPGDVGQTGVPSAQHTDSEPGNAGQTGVPSAQYTDLTPGNDRQDEPTSVDELRKTSEAKAKVRQQLAAFLCEPDSTGGADVETLARGLRKDLLQDLQEKDHQDLQDLRSEQDEDPENLVTRILRRELQLIRELKHPDGIYPWILFAIAAMKEGIPIDWPYARGFTFCESDCIKLQGIIERANKQPKDPDPKDPKQKCARKYFLGAVAGLIAEAVEEDKQRAASIADSEDFWKCYRQVKATAKRIGYPWQDCEMFTAYDPCKPAPRFNQLRTRRIV